MPDFSKFALTLPRFLLPAEKFSAERWAVIACDQHTSNPRYWQDVEAFVADNPSTLRMIFPECYLKDRTPDTNAIHATMEQYSRDVLTRIVDGFILVERNTTCGNRLGLVVALDLEHYNYYPDKKPLVRCTEGTVLSRIPPRMAIRRGAPVELGHVMVLADDPKRTLIEPLYALRDTLPLLYDFDTMAGGGHLRGWQVSGEKELEMIHSALSELYDTCDGFLFAVGDGNHSLATAKACWEELKPTLPEDQRATHPARYAMVELVNLYDPALVFEPIHRIVKNADTTVLQNAFIEYCKAHEKDTELSGGKDADVIFSGTPLRISRLGDSLPVSIVQEFLDVYTKEHTEVEVDYIHGLDALYSLSGVQVQLRAMDKSELFPYVRSRGPLPRKTFSMGEAQDKRYYMECRSLI